MRPSWYLPAPSGSPFESVTVAASKDAMPPVYHENRSQIQMALGENHPGTDPCSRLEGARLKRLSQMCSAGSALPTTADLFSGWLAVKLQ